MEDKDMGSQSQFSGDNYPPKPASGDGPKGISGGQKTGGKKSY